MTARQPTEERRRQIADAALKVIAEHGLGRFTTQAIAAEVGVTDGSLFRHFASKEDIVFAALDQIEERLFDGFPPDDVDPIARLERFFRFRAAIVGEQPIIAALAFSLELRHAAGERGAAQVDGWKRRTLAFIAQCIVEAQGQGRLREGLEPPAVAIAVLGTLLALVQLGELGRGSVDGAWDVVASLFRPVSG